MQQFFIYKETACHKCKYTSKVNPNCPVCGGSFLYTRKVKLDIIPRVDGQEECDIFLKEVRSITQVSRPSDSELVQMAVLNAKPPRGVINISRWRSVEALFRIKPGVAQLLCREAGVNPDEFLSGGFCGDCTFNPENNRGK